MREIKFRGKRLDGKGWAVGYLVKMWGAWHIIDWNDENTAYAVDPATIGQYTGLKDIDGKEIYEGDILQMYGNERYMYQVEYMRVKASFIGRCIETEIGLAGITACAAKKIIGNIHDNPELLNS